MSTTISERDKIKQQIVKKKDLAWHLAQAPTFCEEMIADGAHFPGSDDYPADDLWRRPSADAKMGLAKVEQEIREMKRTLRCLAKAS